MDCADNIKEQVGLVYLEPKMVHARWKDFSHFIAAAIANCPWSEYSAEQLRTMLAVGQAICWFAQKPDGTVIGAIVTQIGDYPSARIGHVMAIGGRGVDLLWGDYLGWLKSNGVTKLRGYGTPAIARLWTKLGMSEVARVIELEL